MSRTEVGRAYLVATLLLVWWICGPEIRSAHAQSAPTNLALYQQLAIDCLTALPLQEDSLIIAAPASHPYLLNAVVGAIEQRGTTVFVPDPVQPVVAELSWIVGAATVQYSRGRSKMVARTVRLDLNYMLVSSDGRVMANGPCNQSYSDTVARSELPSLESSAFPETQAELPESGWLRRYLEPVVLAVATGLAAFLFFNLRSDRADT